VNPGYVDKLTSVIGHADRAAPLRDYCVGLVAAEGRKSVEPMAAATAPARVSVRYQKLLHFVAESLWSDKRVLAKVREMVVPAIEQHGSIEAWIIDDTSFPKPRAATRSECLTLSIANRHASLPIVYRLYLPEKWAEDAARRKKTRIPGEIHRHYSQQGT
jgi:SRSO17 transposase